MPEQHRAGFPIYSFEVNTTNATRGFHGRVVNHFHYKRQYLSLRMAVNS